MNLAKLKQAETQFLDKYPEGFMHPDLQALGKKHKMEQMIALAQESFSKNRFRDPQTIAENMVKIISRSSMVSMFEKPKFRDATKGFSEKDTKLLSSGLKNFLHGNQQRGFETMVDVLKPIKLAKWSLVTIIPNYYHPDKEVFVKPTTAKGVIQYFELEDLAYKPAPTWEFYQKYRDAIAEMRAKVDKSIAPNNAAFGGFLMMNLNS